MMRVAWTSPRALYAAWTSPRALYAAWTSPPIPVDAVGRIYDDQTGALLYDDVTGAVLTW